MAKKELASYYRAMHNLGAIPGKDTHIRGGADVLSLISADDLELAASEGTDLARLYDLGALREATAEEVEEWERRDGVIDSYELITNASNGNPFVTAAEENATKGELSEKTVTELKALATARGIENVEQMKKAELLTALTQ